MLKVVFIAGLIHSGSTFFERLLASQPGLVGLGELQQAVTQSLSGARFKRGCSCGAPVADCPLWGPVIAPAGEGEGSKPGGPADPAGQAGPAAETGRGEEPGRRGAADPAGAEGFDARFQAVLKHFAELYPNAVLVESSKGPHRLNAYKRAIRAGLAIDLRVLYVFRDVRGWAHAIKRKGPAEGDDSMARGRGGLLRHAYYWAAKVYLTLRALGKGRFPWLPVCYESVVFNPRAELERVMQFLEQPFDPERALQQTPTSHALAGNAMRYDPFRSSAIVYDPAWMRDWPLFWVTPFILPPLAYNTYLQRRHSAAITTKPPKKPKKKRKNKHQTRSAAAGPAAPGPAASGPAESR